jgi:hypothetical protein
MLLKAARGNQADVDTTETRCPSWQPQDQAEAIRQADDKRRAPGRLARLRAAWRAKFCCVGAMPWLSVLVASGLSAMAPRHVSPLN